MPEVGVMAVVEGLSAFVGDMNKIQSSIEGVVPPASILQDAFGALGEAAASFASWVGDVLTYTLGNLLADAIEGIISLMGDLINKTIEAGNEFQTLDLRLRGFNLDALMKSGMGYNDATQKSIDLTKEQLSWLQKLAAATPYDNTDISQTYSLARAYGFTDDEARSLTQDTGNFAAAMGLTGETLEMIIRNFGQMRARGKITSTELRDLARGSFMPLDDVLGRVAKKMNITTEALTKLISKPGGGVDEQLFINAFQEMIAQEPRFTGAAERMARTFGSATDNVKDLVTSFGGLNIIKPILDVLGTKIANFMDQFIKSDAAGQTLTALGQRLLDASVNIGKALSDIVTNVLGLLPSTDSLAKGLVSGLESVGNWLSTNKDAIVGKIQEIMTWFSSLGKSEFVVDLTHALQDLYNQLFNVMNAGDIPGWQLLKFAIEDVAAAIGGTFTSVIRTLGLDDLPSMSFRVKDLVLALLSFSAWIRENRELLTWLLIIIGSFIILQTITNLVWTFIAGLVGMVFTVGLVIASLGGLAVIFSVITNSVIVFKLNMIALQTTVDLAIRLIIGHFQNMKNTFNNIITEIQNSWRTGNWFMIGADIIIGIVRGIESEAGLLMSAVSDAAVSAYNAALSSLGIHSPSKLFSGVGENIMLGMAEGIQNSTGAAVAAMNAAVSAVAMPAMSAPSITQQYTQAAPKSISSTYQSNNQYNLNINSSANTEPIISDFNMLASMAGV